VEVGFPADGNCQLVGMEITLSQKARSNCELKFAIDNYRNMPELSKALAAGMTPIVSYWSSADMLWMDGKGSDGRGPCARDSPDDCSKRTKFSNFSVSAIPGTACKAKLTDQQPAKPNLLVTDVPDVLVSVASAKEVTDVPDVLASVASAKESTITMTITTTTTTTTITATTTTKTTTTLLASKDIADRGAGSFQVSVGLVGTLGFLGGAMCLSIVFAVVAYIRSGKSQKMKRTLPSSNSLVSMASARELAQQLA